MFSWLVLLMDPGCTSSLGRVHVSVPSLDMPVYSVSMSVSHLKLVMGGGQQSWLRHKRRQKHIYRNTWAPLSFSPCFQLVYHLFFFLSWICHLLFLTSFSFPHLSLLFVQMCSLSFYLYVFFFSLFFLYLSHLAILSLVPFCSVMWNLVVIWFPKWTLRQKSRIWKWTSNN